jgi:hypothetical protein
MLNVVMLSAIMLSAIMLSVVMLNVVAPLSRGFADNQSTFYSLTKIMNKLKLTGPNVIKLFTVVIYEFS